MDFLDGWAIAIGGSACRFFARNGHDALQGMICADGSYSAGWKVFAGVLALGLTGYFMFRLLKPGP